MSKQKKFASYYMFVNFGDLIAFALPSALLLSVFFCPLGEVRFFAEFINGEIDSSRYFQSLVDAFIFQRFCGRYWFLSVFALIAFAVSQCLFVVKIAGHMKTGEMPEFPFEKAFGLLGHMLFYVFSTVLAISAVSFAIIGIGTFVNATLGTEVSFIVTYSLGFVMQIFACYLFATLLLAFPIKYTENYTFGSALAYSVRATNGCKRYIWTFALVYPLIRLIANTLAYFYMPVLCYLFYFIFFVFFTMYVPCMAYSLFYDTIGGVRRDLSTSVFD